MFVRIRCPQRCSIDLSLELVVVYAAPDSATPPSVIVPTPQFTASALATGPCSAVLLIALLNAHALGRRDGCSEHGESSPRYDKELRSPGSQERLDIEADLGEQLPARLAGNQRGSRCLRSAAGPCAPCGHPAEARPPKPRQFAGSVRLIGIHFHDLAPGSLLSR
jgi:hypothetical protein